MKKEKDINEEVKQEQAEAAEAAAGTTAEAAAEATAEQNAADPVEDLTLKLNEANDKYLRIAAEFDNYRRRTAKERLDLIASAGENVIKGLLPVIDDFERALEAMAKAAEGGDAAAKAVLEGTELIYNKLIAYLKQQGVARIEAVGGDFDTDFHEAVAQFPVEEAERKNKVIDVAQQGYTLNGKVIRYAKVVIGI
ncbi:MAG: nucleotide exchange factor GrpE [Bacteroidales bacterium]|nr:nucleotide exchange factor GrpE [Bacteroidales bacterium]